MTVTYQVQVLQTDRQDWLDSLRQAIAAELSDLGVHYSVTVSISDQLVVTGTPSVSVVLVGPETASDSSLTAEVAAARERGVVVVPVVDDLRTYQTQVPTPLSPLNGFEWSGEAPERRLAQLILEELGIEERERRVFLSHRRTDGLGAAEQLHDTLSHARFLPFIDRFGIPAGHNVQNRIADALEEFAFLVLLETPEAHLSEWVFDEVDYALAHSMGILIVQWPDGPPAVPGSVGLPRLVLESSDIAPDAHGYDTFTSSALDRIVQEIEANHARAIVRRRRMLLRNVQESAEAADMSCTILLNWMLAVDGPSGRTIVGVAPRLPESEDLQNIDDARGRMDPSADAMLVHAARRIDEQRKGHLDWVSDGRNLSMLPENRVGGIW